MTFQPTGGVAGGFGQTKTQTCYFSVGIVYNPMPLPLLSGSTVLLTDENSLPFVEADFKAELLHIHQLLLQSA